MPLLVAAACVGSVVQGCRYGYDLIERQGRDVTQGGSAGDPQGGSGGGAHSTALGGEGGDATPACPTSSQQEWFEDADNDGVGNIGVSLLSCMQPDGFVDNGGDCADDPISDDDCNGLSGDQCTPGNGEPTLCDGADNDCDGTVDEDCLPPLPLMDSSLLLWLDGADANTIELTTGVAGWLDKSGRDNHVSQPDVARQPTVLVEALNRRSALLFDGVNDSLVGDNSSGVFDSVDLDVILVLSPHWETDPGGNPSPFAIRGEGSGLTRVSLHLSGQLNNFHHFNGTFQQFAMVPFTPQEYYLLEDSFDVGATVTTQYLNGQLIGSDTDNYFGDPLQPVRIGAAQNDLEPFQGVIAEVILYDRTLLDDERMAIEAYVEAKWGIDTTP